MRIDELRDRIGALWTRWYLSGPRDDVRGYWWVEDAEPHMRPVSREQMRSLDDRLREEHGEVDDAN